MRSIRTQARVVPALLSAMLLTHANAASPRDEKVYQAAQANRAGALDLLKEIVNIDSGTGDVAGGDKVDAVLRARLKPLGAEVRSEPAEAPGLPDNLVAVFHGTGKGRSSSSLMSIRFLARAPRRHGRSAWTRPGPMAPAWAMKRRAW